MTGFFLFRHIRYYFRWNSGVSDSNYVEAFDNTVEMTRSTHLYTEAAANFFSSRIRPYVSESLKRFRDPLHLTFFVSDPLILDRVVRSIPVASGPDNGQLFWSCSFPLR